MRLASHVLALAFILVTTDAFAQPSGNAYAACGRALQPDDVSLRTSDSVRLSWLATIDQERFNEERRNLDAGGSVPVDGIPLAAHASYGEFYRSRDREFRSTDFRYSRDEAYEFLQTRLSPAALTAWVRCLEIQAGNAQGLQILPVRFGPGFVDIKVTWSVPQLDAVFSSAWFSSTPDPGAVFVTGAELPSNFPKRLSPSGTWDGTFQWDGRKPFYLALNTQQRSASLRLLPEPLIKQVEDLGSCMPPSSEGDLGYPETRVNYDLDNDGCADLCRIIGIPGAFRLLCTFGKRERLVLRDKIDYALPVQIGRRFFTWADIDRDGAVELCWVRGNNAACRTVEATGFGKALDLGTVADAGYDTTQRWADVNADGELDFCRQVGLSQPFEVCTPMRKMKLNDAATSRYR